MKTREKIKDAAIRLFNEKGATNVSTVLLSEKMKISPGNLYYYFTNKEHIIRTIWEEDMVPETDAIYFRDHEDAPHVAMFRLLEDFSDHAMKYRFFYTEIYTLIKNDPKLQWKYKERWDQLVPHLVSMLEAWEARDLIRATTPGFKNVLCENLLLIGPATIHSSLALHPEMKTREALRHSVVSACVMLCGLYSEEVRQELMALLAENNYPVHCS